MLFLNTRKFALVVIALLMSVLTLFVMPQNAFAAKSKVKTNASAVKITPIDFEKTEKMSALQILNMIVEQDKSLSEVFEKSKNTQNNDKLFEIFYNNVSDAVFIIHGKFEYFNRENIDDEEQTHLNIGGIEFVSPKKDDMYEIIKPKTDLFTYQSSLEFDSFKMNDKYINEKYAKSLSKPWKRYLYLSVKNTEPCAADVDGYNIDQKTAEEWIKSWSEFLALYPDFPKNNDIQEVIDFVKEQFSENEETE